MYFPVKNILLIEFVSIGNSKYIICFRLCRDLFLKYKTSHSIGICTVVPLLQDNSHQRPPLLQDNSHQRPPLLQDNSHQRPPLLQDNSHQRPPLLQDNSHQRPPLLQDNSHLIRTDFR